MASILRGKKNKQKKKNNNQVQKSKVFTLRKKRARVLRRVEWLPFYEGGKKKKKKKKKKNKSKSPRFLRCLKKKGIKARVLRRVEWLPFYAEGEKIVVIIKKKKISFFKNHQKIPTAFALVFFPPSSSLFCLLHPSIHPSIHPHHKEINETFIEC